jgi:hypothetical protein
MIATRVFELEIAPTFLDPSIFLFNGYIATQIQRNPLLHMSFTAEASAHLSE